MTEAVTEKEDGGEVLNEGVQPETDGGGRGTEIERSGRAAAAETEKPKQKRTKAVSKGKRVKTGTEGGVGEVERGSAPVHLSHLTARGLTSKATL